MKNFYFPVFLAIVLAGCNKHDYGRSATGGISSEPPSSINIRVQNGLNNRIVNTAVLDIPFGDIDPGASSSFRKINSSVGEASCRFSINGQTVSVKSDVHSCGNGVSIGATSGNYTFMIVETIAGHYSLSVSKN